MRVLFAGIILLAGLISCNQKKSDSKPSASTPKQSTAMQVIVDTTGEYDPIANQSAVSGGTYNTWGSSYPKSFNMWLDYNSFSSEIMGYLYEGLATLHPVTNDVIGELAIDWEVSADSMTYTFKIDPKAKWSDGKDITADDIQFYYDVIMNPENLTPIFRVGLKRFERPVVVDSKTISIKAKEKHWKNFWDVAGMVAFPKHIWEGKDFNKINSKFEVVSGPYKIGEIKKNRYVTLKRRADWWARYKKFNQFKYNFDKVKYKFIQDRVKALEAFKKGEFDLYPIYTAKIWVKQTDFDQVQKNWVVKQRVYNKEPKGYSGFAMNLRKKKFQDAKVRKALAHLLNREKINEKLMFNEYQLLNSYYPDLYPNGVNPDQSFSNYDPDTARKLLAEAGWKVNDKGVLEKDGEEFTIAFPTAMSDLRHLNVYLEDLKKVGIKASIETLTWSTISKRMDSFDYDMFWVSWGASRLRNPESMFHSKGADQKGSQNYPGVADSIIDDLIEQQKTMFSLDDRIEILKKIDKRLNEISPYVLLWGASNQRVLYWNKFGTPVSVYDKFNREDVVVKYWYVDAEKEKAINAAKASGSPLPSYPSEVRYKD